MSGIGSASASEPSPPAAQYPALAQMGLVPPPGVDVAYENFCKSIPTNQLNVWLGEIREGGHTVGSGVVSKIEK
mgnify:CR=1 FL=1